MSALDDLRDYLATRRPNTYRPLPPISCRDGFSMSVQANRMAYCSPRMDTGPWEEVEIGYPNRIEPLLMEYAEDMSDMTGTVYPYVPIELVAAIIELHGGMVLNN